jgi:hypothetical protein
LNNTTNEFDEIEKAAADKRRVQDFDDLQNELSGNEVGRISRFLSPEARALLTGKQNGKQSAYMTALDLALMNNPEFFKAYEAAMNTLGDVENVAERVLTRLVKQQADIEVQLKDAEAEYQNTLDNAATLADGTRVFRDTDGNVWNEHGKHVDGAIAASIEWSGLEPSQETYLQQQKSVHDLGTSLEEVENSILEIRVYQTDVLGNVRAELSNPDHSGRVKDVEAAKDRVLDRMPESLRSEYRMDSVEPEVTTTSTFSVAEPNLGG